MKIMDKAFDALPQSLNQILTLIFSLCYFRGWYHGTEIHFYSEKHSCAFQKDKYVGKREQVNLFGISHFLSVLKMPHRKKLWKEFAYRL
jgi:hypothetical protein